MATTSPEPYQLKEEEEKKDGEQQLF